jgi:hypothetical protein
MKNFLLLFLFLISIQINAQLTYELRVVDNQQRAVSNLPILLKETSTKEKIKLRTDGGGNVLIELKSGNRWIVSIGKMYNYKVLDVPQSGYRKSRELMTYDLERWERENRPMPDRSTINFQTVKKNSLQFNQANKSRIGC